MRPLKTTRRWRRRVEMNAFQPWDRAWTHEAALGRRRVATSRARLVKELSRSKLREYVHFNFKQSASSMYKEITRKRTIGDGTVFLRSLGEPDAVVAVVEFGVVWAKEDVAENPQRTGGRRDIHAHETADALIFATIADA